MKLITLLISLCLFFPLTALSATDDVKEYSWFTIEVISFSRNKNSQLTEKWPFVPPIEVIEDITLTPELPDFTDNNQLDIIPVPDDEMELKKQAYSLGRSSSITIQSHQAWRQKGLDKENAPWINLSSKNERLTGKIQISLARYLHANLDMSILNPDWNQSQVSYENTLSDNSNMTRTSKQIPFISHRRMRSGELHFIDHPLAGVLIKIERYTLPTTETISSQALTINANEINPS